MTFSLQLEEQPTPGQLKPGPRAFISHQNNFGEETRGFIQSTQDLIGQAISSLITIVIDHRFAVYIAADMSLTSRPSRTKTEEFKNLKGMASNIRSLAEWCVYMHDNFIFICCGLSQVARATAVIHRTVVSRTDTAKTEME